MPTDPLESDALAAAIVARYATRLVALARDQIGVRLAQRIDSEDVVQSVFRTFFRRAAEGQFEIDETTDLWKLLASITQRKVISKARVHQAQKRDMRQEVDAILIDSAATSEASPMDAVILLDLIEWLVRDTDDLQRQVLGMRLAGHTRVEIAESQRVSRRTVTRILEQFEARLRRADADA